MDAATSDTTGLILSATGWASGELEAELERKQAEFSGLLTRQGALELVAREKGVAVERKAREVKFSKLAQTSPTDGNANVRARVWHVFSAKYFTKKTVYGDKQGKVRNIIVKDSSGDATLVLWGKDADWPQQVKLKRNTVLEVAGANVKTGASGLELHSGLSTRISLSNEQEGLPVYEKKVTPPQALASGALDVDVNGRVVTIGRKSEFQRVKKTGEVEKGYVCDCVLQNEGKNFRLVAWDANCAALEGLKQGDDVSVEGASVKASRDGKELEIHAGWASNIVVYQNNAQTEAAIVQSSLAQAMQAGQGSFDAVAATVAEITSAWSMLKCSNCGQKSPLKPDAQKNCGCGGEFRKLFVVKATLADEKTSLECVFFNEEALALTGLSAIPADATTLIELKKAEITGKKLVFGLKIKKNDFTQAVEGVISSVSAAPS